MAIVIDFDPIKRKVTLAERGLDFSQAGEVFDGKHFTRLDDRKDYLEDRYITVGWLGTRLVVLVWTQRGKARRVISMRKANEREQKLFFRFMERS